MDRLRPERVSRLHCLLDGKRDIKAILLPFSWPPTPYIMYFLSHAFYLHKANDQYCILALPLITRKTKDLLLYNRVQ